VLERGLGHPHLAKLRHDLCFEPCGHGNDVATAGRLVLCLVINEFERQPSDRTNGHQSLQLVLAVL
jgi:hypothetical protein